MKIYCPLIHQIMSFLDTLCYITYWRLFHLLHGYLMYYDIFITKLTSMEIGENFRDMTLARVMKEMLLREIRCLLEQARTQYQLQYAHSEEGQKKRNQNEVRNNEAMVPSTVDCMLFKQTKYSMHGLPLFPLPKTWNNP